MKLFTVSALIACGLAGLAHAQQASRTAMEAFLLRPKQKPVKIYVLSGTPANFSFVNTLQSTQTRNGKVSGGASLYFMQPKEFVAAMDLFEGRKYSEAAAGFGAFAQKYASFKAFKENYATLASYYEMESLRKQFDVAGLVAKAASFNSKPLGNAEQVQQVEIYKFWELLHAKSWDQLVTLSEEWQAKSIPDTHRAQIAYCHAVALKEQGKLDAAIDAYSTAFTVDTFKSHELVNQAALEALDLYLNQKEVAAAIKAWGTAKQDKAGQGYKWLVEANALARLYNTTGMGGGVDLDARFAPILKCTPSN
ncbi:hypothetical protein [Rubritalea marina]|uniref:hypothetical protein n=1 Tax=Rubritalea marina TaxID=361055 RepID=UPI00036F1984|nr:hypothetical protein [Rubritalea marina]